MWNRSRADRERLGVGRLDVPIFIPLAENEPLPDIDEQKYNFRIERKIGKRPIDHVSRLTLDDRDRCNLFFAHVIQAQLIALRASCSSDGCEAEAPDRWCVSIPMAHSS